LLLFITKERERERERERESRKHVSTYRIYLWLGLLINEKEDWKLHADGHVTCCAIIYRKLIEMTLREINHHRAES
jgi:hypothetical protein